MLCKLFRWNFSSIRCIAAATATSVIITIIIIRLSSSSDGCSSSSDGGSSVVAAAAAAAVDGGDGGGSCCSGAGGSSGKIRGRRAFHRPRPPRSSIRFPRRHNKSLQVCAKSQRIGSTRTKQLTEYGRSQAHADRQRGKIHRFAQR